MVLPSELVIVKLLTQWTIVLSNSENDLRINKSIMNYFLSNNHYQESKFMFTKCQCIAELKQFLTILTYWT